jgi:hypothetical protein
LPQYATLVELPEHEGQIRVFLMGKLQQGSDLSPRNAQTVGGCVVQDPPGEGDEARPPGLTKLLIERFRRDLLLPPLVSYHSSFASADHVPQVSPVAWWGLEVTYSIKQSATYKLSKDYSSSLSSPSSLSSSSSSSSPTSSQS